VVASCWNSYEETKMADEANWLDHRDIDRWASLHREHAANKDLAFAGEDDPVDELEERLARGYFVGKKRTSVEIYVERARAAAYRFSEGARVDREERATAAAERAADAADRSARWAGWAIAVSMAALLVAGWPFIKEWVG
jgi:hypothetical protein